MSFKAMAMPKFKVPKLSLLWACITGDRELYNSVDKLITQSAEEANARYFLAQTLYKVNPNGAYALYSNDNGKTWRESAMYRNERLPEIKKKLGEVK